MTAQPRETRRRVYVLKGSSAGPGFLGVTHEGAWPDDWTDERLEQEAAAYHGVPAAQATVLHDCEAHDFQWAPESDDFGICSKCGKEYDPDEDDDDE